jgi:flagellar hook-associated protein 1 FlgK
MPGLFGALSVGARGLQAQQYGAQVSGANIANATTDGYHREDTQITSGGAFSGTQAVTIKRAGQSYLEQNVRQQAATAKFSYTRAQQLVPVQDAMADLSSSGLGQSLSDVFASLRNLSASPADLAVRADVLGRLQGFVGHVNQSGQALLAQRAQLDQQVRAIVSDANSQIKVIASLNADIAAAIASGDPATNLMDSRDSAVQALAQDVGARVDLDRSGNYTVTIGEGLTVVNGASTLPLGTATDPVTGLQHVVLPNTSFGTLDARLSGSAGGMLQVRDQDIVTAQSLLDGFAYDTLTAMNTAHLAGTDLQGNPGANLFTPTALAGAAVALTLNPALAGNPQKLAAAQSGTPLAPVPGDNRNADVLVALQTSLVASGATQTLHQSLGSIVAIIGAQKQQADVNTQQGTNRLQQAENLREQESGVNVEEQIIHLTQFQTAHGAAARFISVIDDMLSTLLKL